MIRVGTIGTSSITARTVAAGRGVAGLSFTAVHSRDAARGAALAAELGIPHSHDDLATFLAADVDAVYVASPNAVHASQVRAALEAGRHVLCEKPAVATAAEWDELCALARERGLVLMENMRTAHDPVMRRVVELLPALGPVRRVSLHLAQYSSRYDLLLAGERPTIFDPALGGGALADVGVYAVHPLVRLFGPPRTVAAATVGLSTGVDGAGDAVLGYDGMVAHLGWSKITAGAAPCTIEGERATLCLDHVTELRTLTVRPLRGDATEESPAKEPDNITYALRRFVDLVEGRAAVDDDQRWTRDSLATMERIRAAATG